MLQESQGGEAGSGPVEDVGLEELRYRWMLYKSKLKDMGDLRARLSVKVRTARCQQREWTINPVRVQKTHV